MNRLQTKMDCLHKQLVNGHRSHVGDLMINLFFAFRSTFNGWVSPKMANLRPKMAKCGRLVNVPKSYHFASPANCTLCFQCKKNVSNYNLQKKNDSHSFNSCSDNGILMCVQGTSTSHLYQKKNHLV